MSLASPSPPAPPPTSWRQANDASEDHRKRRRKKKRTPNDIRDRPAAPDTIDSLLASFSVISPTDDYEEDPLQSPPSSYQSPLRSRQGSVRSQSLNSQSQGLDFGFSDGDDGTAYPDNNGYTPQGAAEAPVVRTSRPSSRLSSRYYHPAPKPTNVIRQPDPAYAPSPSIPKKSSARRLKWGSGQTSGDASPLPRASGDVRQEESATPDMKGKSRAVAEANQHSTPRMARRAGGVDPNPADIVYSPAQSSSQFGSRKPTARQSIDGNDSTPAGRAAATDIHDGVTSRTRRFSGIGQDGESNAVEDGRGIIPDRTTSLRYFEESPKFTSIPQRPSTRHSMEGGNATKIPADIDDDDEAYALRRVQQLKAAKEERRRSLKQQTNNELSVIASTPGFENDASPAPQIRPPESSQASKQLSEASGVHERTINVNGISADRSFLPQRPPVLGSGFTSNAPRPSSSGYSETATRKRYSVSYGPDEAQGRPSTAKRRPSIQQTNPLGEPSNADLIKQSVQEFVSAPRLSQKLFIPTERRAISFSEVGDRTGHVVFCCVGMGLTRFVTAFYDELAMSLRLRLITLDRPGVGDSDPYIDGPRPPLNWPDDVEAICEHLGITTFSLLAHSAGVIYALATALRMPAQVRGKIHLLAPWIPPSQISAVGGLPATTGPPRAALSKTQRFLRILPLPFLKLTNASFLSSISGNRTATPKQGNNKKRRSIDYPPPPASAPPGMSPRPSMPGRPSIHTYRTAPHLMSPQKSFSTDKLTPPATPRFDQIFTAPTSPTFASPLPYASSRPSISQDREMTGPDRQRAYDSALTAAIWELATRNANPAIDLLVCLERNTAIGFQYSDINAGMGVVLHHGSKDSRVPMENVKWLGRSMRRAEVRILEGEGHGLMARAGVMGAILSEIAKEWDRVDTSTD